MPVKRYAEKYNMNHRCRGLALIFNHKNFDPCRGIGTRNGTDVDRDNLELTLKDLDFEVRIYEDLTFIKLVSSGPEIDSNKILFGNSQNEVQLNFSSPW